MQGVFREVHSLKGNARALNLESIGKTAHELEDVFEELKEKPEEITEELKLKTLQAVEALKNDIQDGNALFKKILNMQSALQDKGLDAMSEFEERFRKVVEIEARARNKSVAFKFENKLEKPLDAALINKLCNPLSHILRNSISHGIETSEMRRKLNKPIMGRVTLRLTRTRDVLTLICEDDGGGLDAGKIKEKAQELNLFNAETLSKMSDAEIYKLIFSSGLSTTEGINEGSGRGVGMDAVRADLKILKAIIGISTRAKEFTRFTIQIPGA